MAVSARILVTLLALSCVVSAQDLETNVREFLRRFDEEATQRMYNYSLASWAYNTDISKENSDKLVSTGKDILKFPKDTGAVTSFFLNHLVFSLPAVRAGANLGKLLHSDVRRVPEVPHRPDQRSRNQTAAHLPSGQRLRCSVPGQGRTRETAAPP